MESVAVAAARVRAELSQEQYWKGRQGAVYLAAARRLCEVFCPDPGSVIDVGSNGTPTLEWQRGERTRLVSCDLMQPYRAKGVESIRGDFLEYEPDTPFDLVTCLQVLEHVPDATTFARKLLAVGRVLVVSVPYRWPEGRNKHHVHDPVDDAKMRSWFGREPTYRYLAKEPINGVARLIHVYAPEDITVVGKKVLQGGVPMRQQQRASTQRRGAKRSLRACLKSWLGNKLR